MAFTPFTKRWSRGDIFLSGGDYPGFRDPIIPISFPHSRHRTGNAKGRSSVQHPETAVLDRPVQYFRYSVAVQYRLTKPAMSTTAELY